MPRLVLEDDDGRVLFSGEVSRKNVEIVARFLRRNMPALQAAVAVKQVFSQISELLQAEPRLPSLDAPARPRARGGRRR